MVDFAAIIMSNLMFIMIGVIALLTVIVVYFVYQKQKMRARALARNNQAQMPDVELTKTNLPGKTGMVSKGKLESALQNSQKESSELKEGKENLGMRRRPLRRTARRTTRRRTARQSTRRTTRRRTRRR